MKIKCVSIVNQLRSYTHSGHVFLGMPKKELKEFNDTNVRENSIPSAVLNDCTSQHAPVESYNISSVNFNYLTHERLVTKLRDSREREEHLKDRVFLLSSSLKRSIKSKESFKIQLKDLCNKGSYNIIAYNVIKALEVKKEQLSRREGVLDMLKTISNNLRKEHSSKVCQIEFHDILTSRICFSD